MDMGFINKYPYTDFHELNLDFILSTMKTLVNEVTNFVSLNAIKYADPIQWDITRQYEKNTVVIDPLTGTAYISVAPVPIGVQLNRPEYWTVVFDLGSFVVRAAKNFSPRYEAETTTSATMPISAGQWVVWGDTLYKANVNITPGDTYVVGGNIDEYTVEEAQDDILALIGDLNNLSTTDKTSLVNAINEVLTTFSSVTGDLNDLNTTDKTSLVNAINEVLTTFSSVAGDLNDLNTTDKTSLVNAINEVLTTFSSVTGDLNNLVTTDKTSIVNAINSLKNSLPWYNVSEYGILPGNNVYDDLYDLLHDVVNPAGGGVVYFPKGQYIIDYTIFIPENTIFIGDGEESEIYFDLTDTHIGCAVTNGGSNVGIINMSVNIATNAPYNIRGAIPNAIGIGDFDFNGLTGKRIHESPRKSGIHNILLENTYSRSSNYSVQMQPKTYAVGDIVVLHHEVPTGMFSIAHNQAAVGADAIYNCYVSDVVCDTFRVETTTYKNDKIFIDNIVATQISIYGYGTRLSNFTLNAGDGNRALDSYEHNCALNIWGLVYLSDGYITKSTTTNPFAIIKGSTNVSTPKADRFISLSNIYVDDPTAFTLGAGVDTHSTTYAYVNCNFTPYTDTYMSIRNHTLLHDWPVLVKYNYAGMHSRIKGYVAYPGGTNASTRVARANDTLAVRTMLFPDTTYGYGYLFKSTDLTVPPEPVVIEFTGANTNINVLRDIDANSRADFDAVYIDVEW